MPDITMCTRTEESCPLALTCHRSKASGTQPNEHHQSWAFFVPIKYGNGEWNCNHYVPTKQGEGDD